MHKTFLQFILCTFWCILTHFDSFWALYEKKTTFLANFVHKNCTIHSACILMHMQKCIKMHQHASKCISVHQNASKFIWTLQNASKWLQNELFLSFVHEIVFWKNPFFLVEIDQFFSKCSECINMHQNASKCMQNELCKCFLQENIKKVVLITFK